jgi:hypothetical protein
MKYNIVKIVDEYLVVVNYGEKHNAREGDELEIFEVGETVFDPKNGEDLGTLDLLKGKIYVLNVYEKMSLCKSAEKSVVLGPTVSLGSTLSSMLSNTYETKALNVNTSQITGGYNIDKELLINIGDPVKITKSLYEESLEDED